MKILIVTKNWLGDVLFQIPAIELIRKHYPDAEIACIAPKRCHEILAAHPAVNRVILFDEREEQRSIFKRLDFAIRLRKEKWDRAYLFHRSRTRAFLLLLAGVKERIGYASKRRAFLTRAVRKPKTMLHQVDYFLELLKTSGLSFSGKPAYHFYFSEEDRKSAARLLEENQLETFVCFHLGANWEPKRWPESHFAKLADLISEKWGFSIVLTGAARDLPLASQVMAQVKKARVISLVGETTLGGLGAIYSRAAFVVSGDSGPMHIASGVGAPVVALFGPTNPDLTGPRGTGKKIVLTHVPPGCKVPCYDDKDLPETWLLHIQPEDVMRAIEKENWDRDFPSHQTSLQARHNFGGRGNLNILSSPGLTGGSNLDSRSFDKLRMVSEVEPLKISGKDPFWFKWIPAFPPQRRRDSSGRTSPRFLASAGMTTKKDGVKRILLIALSNIGDVILNTAVITSLAAEFPEAKMTVVTGPRAEGLLKGSRFIHRLVIYDKKSGWLQKLKFIRDLRKENYDYVVDLKNTAIPFLVKTRKRSPVFRRFKEISMRERHLEVLRMMGFRAPSDTPRFDFFNEQEELGVVEKLKAKGIPAADWIVVAPVAASELKTWRLAGFREVVERLLEEQSENILLLGGKRERPMIDSIAELNPARVFNLAGETTLREMAALISRCSLLLTNDSSAMHLGFEINAPVVAIFGPTNFEKAGRKGPRFRIVYEHVSCSPCEQPRCRFERQACLEDLKSEKVFQVCRELLHAVV